MSWANQVIPSTIATWPSKTSVEGLVSDLNGAPISGGGGGGGSVVTGLIAQLAGASAQDIAFIAPANPGGTITGYAVQTFRASDNTLVATAYDWTAQQGSPLATTRRIKGLPAGQQYYHKVAAIVGGVTGTYSAASVSLSIPVIAGPAALTDTLIEYFAPALTATDSSANAVCLHMQKTLNASASDTASTDTYLLNASKAQVSTCIVAVSYSAVAAGGTAVGSAVSAGNAACLNNAGTWSSTFTVNIPVSTSTQGDNAPGMVNIGPQLRAALPPLDRTDFPGGLMIMHVRAYYAVGASYTLCNYMAGNSVNGASQDYELNKEDPAVSLLGGRLMRCFRAFNVDGVTNKAALTTALALAQPNGGLACFFVQKLTSAKARQVVVVGDSRSTMCKPTLHATAGVHALSHAQVSTQANPIGFCHLGADGWGTPRWKDRVTQMTAFFTSVGASTSPLVYLPINSINGWGSGPTIALYSSNATDVEAIRQLWVGVGGRVVKETVLGVDPTSPNYQWTDINLGDIVVRHGGNISAEDASTFATPTIPIATLTEGAIAGNNMYAQTDSTGTINWIEATSAIDTTKAHFTYAWANKWYQFYTPFMQQA